MEKQGYKVNWQDNRKYITFTDKDGHKVRNSNLEKTFRTEYGKENLLHEFERNREKQRETNTRGYRPINPIQRAKYQRLLPTEKRERQGYARLKQYDIKGVKLNSKNGIREHSAKRELESINNKISGVEQAIKSISRTGEQQSQQVKREQQLTRKDNLTRDRESTRTNKSKGIEHER
ncbi:hypothetical protein JYG23_07195 [Sedimentibacter sp. zth1]|uniref:hypothetical protein n=1 Tax=Sedimentibacter sp. zth1 TaxID=2816908 RepID=UPI001A91F374|nr:hypothetical protein [Sedimentibacter sp. zth1]QSX07121.1 hypothetical protein JYG23_07195 [Sedimentibacter sp. zth1]